MNKNSIALFSNRPSNRCLVLVPQASDVSAAAIEEPGIVVVDFSLEIQQGGVWSGWGWVLEGSGISTWRRLSPPSVKQTPFTTRP